MSSSIMRAFSPVCVDLLEVLWPLVFAAAPSFKASTAAAPPCCAVVAPCAAGEVYVVGDVAPAAAAAAAAALALRCFSLRAAVGMAQL